MKKNNKTKVIVVDASKNPDKYRKLGSYDLIIVDNHKRASEKELKFLMQYILFPRVILRKGKVVMGKDYL